MQVIIAHFCTIYATMFQVLQTKIRKNVAKSTKFTSGFHHGVTVPSPRYPPLHPLHVVQEDLHSNQV